MVFLEASRYGRTSLRISQYVHVRFFHTPLSHSSISIHRYHNHPLAKHPTAMGTVLSKPSRPATQEANFTYPRLKNVKNDFRLVKIEERKKGTLLTCQMEVFNIDRLPTYAALSFFWKDGYDEPSQKKKLFPITINGKRHGVNANLHSVLQGLRDTRPGI